MKKTPAFTILFLVLAFVLTGCKKEPKEISIVSKWHITELGDSFYLGDSLVVDHPSGPINVVSTDNIAFFFNSDGTFSRNLYLYFSDQYRVLESGTYKLSDDRKTLKLYANDSSLMDTYKVSFTDKNTMVLIETITYKTPSGINTSTSTTAMFDRYDRTFTFTRL